MDTLVPNSYDASLYITQNGREMYADLRGAQKAILRTLINNKNIGLTLYNVIRSTKFHEQEYRNVDNKILTDAIAKLLAAECVEYK